MNQPTPAIVAERGAQRLPRLALVLLCAAYVLPGIFGRDPWRNADLTAFGFMASLANGHASWWHPAIAGLPAEGGALPYWLGALAIKALPFLDPALAARLPYALVLMGVLVAVWYSSFHLARTEAAQPVAFAFGGEAQAKDYARALADGALLALMASLGLLQLGHETTPELLQLLAIALQMYGLAAAPYEAGKARAAVLLALPMLAASGAPSVAMLLGGLALLICWRSDFKAARQLIPWLAAGLGLAALAASASGAWAMRLRPVGDATQLLELVRLLAWFGWPSLPLALWTVWRWRRQSLRRHIAVPLTHILVPVAACAGMNSSDRALLLALPATACLAAFALPTLKRSFTAAIDWFSLFFFTAPALYAWLYYVSMQTGWPAQPLANLQQRLIQGFEPRFSAFALLLAGAATLTWLALVRWRTARHRHALWKSMALPAGGVALNWLLAMTLLLPALDYAQSLTPIVERLRPHLPHDAGCVAAPELDLPTLAALEFQGSWDVRATHAIQASGCRYALAPSSRPVPAGWAVVTTIKRPTDRKGQQQLNLLRRP